MKSYLILDFKITDTQLFMTYVQAIPAFIAKHNGRYLVEGVTPELVEGNWHSENIVVLEFPFKRDHLAFLNDPDVLVLHKQRRRATESRLICVEGGSWRDKL